MAMTKEEIVEAAKQLPLTERKLLLRDMARAMREDIEVTNPPDKNATLKRLEEIERLHGFPGLSEDQQQPEK
jgi:hypothetical protein